MEKNGLKKDIMHLLIADALILLFCLVLGALLGVCAYGGTAGVLYLIRTVSFIAGGVLLLACAALMMQRNESREKISRKTAGKLFSKIPLFIFCGQAGVISIALGLIADYVVRGI